MIKQLKRRSTIIFSVLNISVLFFVIVLAFQISMKQIEQSEIEVAKNNVNNFVNTLSLTGEIREEELLSLKTESHLDIYIEDNNSPMFLTKNFNSDLIRQCKEILTSRNMFFNEPSQSQVFVLDFLFSLDKKDDTRIIAHQSLGKNNEWISVIAFQSRVREEQKKTSITTGYLFIVGISFVVFLIISRILAEISVKPTVEAMQRQNDFITAASHEIRTPLAVMKANISAMKLLPDKKDYYSDVIENEIDQLARLAEDLSNLTHYDSTKWVLVKNAMDVDTFLMNLYESYLPLMEKKKQILILDLPEIVFPPLIADEERLQQVFSILLNNAISYTQDRSHITLGGEFVDKQMTLFVKDNGEGILRKDTDKIFQPFYQVQNSRTDKHHFGLGLSIAKEIVELHGGQLLYEDTVGGGATFKVLFPISFI